MSCKFFMHVIAFTIWKANTSQQKEHSFWKYLCAKNPQVNAWQVFFFLSFFPLTSVSQGCPIGHLNIWYFQQSYHERHVATENSGKQFLSSSNQVWVHTQLDANDVIEFSLMALSVFSLLLTYWTISASRVHHLCLETTSLEFDVLRLF